MKTILEWFQQLPEPYRTQAIENWKNGIYRNPSAHALSLRGALFKAFRWQNSPQGYEYWDNLSNAILEGRLNEYSPPTPSWQPMTTAPKDGTYVLLHWPYWHKQPVVVGHWHENSWWSTQNLSDCNDNSTGPTHWMPLPKHPSVD